MPTTMPRPPLITRSTSPPTTTIRRAAVSRSSENSRPRKNSSSTIPSRASSSVPSEGSTIVGEPGDGPRMIPATMKTGIADSARRPASTLATASVTRTTARSLSSSREALGAGTAAGGGPAYPAADRAADDLGHVRDALAVHARQQAGGDRPRRARPAVDEPGVDLHQGRPRRELLPGVVGREDPADADDHQAPGRAPGDPGDHRRRARRAAARPTGRPRGRQRGGRDEPLARQGGVGHDHPGEAARERQVDRGVDLLGREVGRELHEHRGRGAGAPGRHARGDLVEGVEDRAERAGRLQVAQPGRVRRADVDDHVVREAATAARASGRSRRGRPRPASPSTCRG